MALNAATVYRDYETDGIPSSGPHKVKKYEVRAIHAGIDSIINAFLSNGGLIFASKASLDASLNYAANTMAWVLGDATVANNGIYRKVGGSGTGSWTRVADLPFSFIIASDVGAGTANAIQATTSIPVSSSALVWTNIFEANTSSPVTISFNGGSALTVKTNSGNNVAAGGLVAGMIVMGIVSGSTFRLISDQASAAIVAAAETAQAAAEAAALEAVALVGLAATALQPGDSVQDLEFLSPVTDAEPRGTQTRLRETYHIRDFHRAEDGTDYTNTIARWQSFVSSSINSPKLLITDGVYEHTNGGNWAKSNVEIKSDGSGTLRNLGTGDNFIVDAGNTDNVWNMLVEGNLLLEGGALSGHGARIRAAHHSQIGSLNVRGCGAAKAGIYMEFGVCSRLIRPIVSLNEGAWYGGAQPLYGLLLERRTGSVDPSPVAFSHVENPVIEHVQYGANLVNALGVRISNGTIEGCTAGGLLISTDSNENVIDRVNFEANNGFDIYCEGDNNEFRSVYSLGTLRDGSGPNDGVNLSGSAHGNKILAGVFNGIILGASTFDNLLMGAAYNRYGNAVTPLNDMGTRNRMVGLYDMTNTVWHDAKRQRTVLTVSGSPFTYSNTTANPQVVIVNGGTVSGIDYINAGVGDTTGETRGTFYLFPGGALQVIYSVAPTMVVQRG